MDWPRDCITEWNKSGRERQLSYDIVYVWNLKKNDINELIYKTEIDAQTWKTNLCIPEGMGRDELELWD